MKPANSHLPKSIQDWKVTFDPYGLLVDEDWLEHAEPVEDILQLASIHRSERILDVGCYQGKYRAVVVENSNWHQPIETFQSTSPRTVAHWVYAALDRLS